jgi:Transposase DDE domain group 1
LRVQAINSSSRVEVTTDGVGVVGHAGAALLGELADRVGLTGALGWRVPGRRRRHLDAAVLRDLAVMLADGGDCLSDLAVLRDQPELFGPVASTPTAWRVLERLAQDPDGLARLRAARAHARGRAWVAGGDPEMELLVIDADATLVLAHSETKEGAAGTYKGSFGFAPLLAYLDRGQAPGSRWPASCGRATPPRALPMTWSSWPTWPWPSSPGPQLTSRSWSAATALGPAPGWPGTCATRVWGSRWGCRSTPTSARRSGPNPSAPGSQQSTPTASPAPALRWSS